MNFKTSIVVLVIALLPYLQSCRDNFNFEELNTDLRFSADTISVDTVYNYSKSETYILKIYNPDNKDFIIPEILLNKAKNSYYKINVDGQAGFKFTNVPIRKNDSLFIFIEIDAKTAPNNPFYEDEIIIKTKYNQQKVKLISWIEKAKIHQKNTKISSENWNSNEAQVIDGDLTITNNLTIEAGTKIYFRKDASLTINENATLNVNGKLDDVVKFRSARHENKYDSIPNQWNHIELKPNSKSNINYAKIIGANIGLYANNAELTISNSFIVNNQSYGILANNAIIKAYNLIVNNANLAALAIENGGNYEFYQSTFANYFNMIGTAGDAYALILDNSKNLLKNAFFGNCIFYNQRTPNSIAIRGNTNYFFDTNLFKNDNSTLINVITNTNFNHSVVGNPLFTNPIYTANQLRLKENSPALNIGNVNIANQYPLDYYGINRTINPSLGAIQ